MMEFSLHVKVAVEGIVGSLATAGNASKAAVGSIPSLTGSSRVDEFGSVLAHGEVTNGDDELAKMEDGSA